MPASLGSPVHGPPRSSAPTPWRAGRTIALAAIAIGAFLLCASVVAAAAGSGRAVPTVSAEAERTMQGAKVSLRGTGWPARTELTISASAPPGASAALELGTSKSNADGEFRATKLSKCTTPDPTTAMVTITVKAGTQSATTRLDASPWVCMRN